MSAERACTAVSNVSELGVDVNTKIQVQFACMHNLTAGERTFPLLCPDLNSEASFHNSRIWFRYSLSKKIVKGMWIMCVCVCTCVPACDRETERT